jgi:hypothetical protein
MQCRCGEPDERCALHSRRNRPCRALARKQSSLSLSGKAGTSTCTLTNVRAHHLQASSTVAACRGTTTHRWTHQEDHLHGGASQSPEWLRHQRAPRRRALRFVERVHLLLDASEGGRQRMQRWRERQRHNKTRWRRRQKRRRRQHQLCQQQHHQNQQRQHQQRQHHNRRTSMTQLQ